LTFLGYWLLLALVLAWLPRYWRTLGIWSVIAVSYVFGVYLISVENVHYIAPVWAVIFVILPVPIDFLLGRVFGPNKTAATAAP
jgi:hypothetical protein